MEITMQCRHGPGAASFTGKLRTILRWPFAGLAKPSTTGRPATERTRGLSVLVLGYLVGIASVWVIMVVLAKSDPGLMFTSVGAM